MSGTVTLTLSREDVEMLQSAIDDGCWTYEQNVQADIDADAAREAILHLEELSRRLSAALAEKVDA